MDSPVLGERVFLPDREVVSQALLDCLGSADGVLDIEYRLRDDAGKVRWAHTRARRRAGAIRPRWSGSVGRRRT